MARTRNALVLLGMTAMLAAPACRREAPNRGPGHRPDVSAVTYFDAAGAQHSLAEHRGKVVVVDVWATWCPPCRKALPEMAALQRQGRPDVVVLAISVDRGGWADVKPFLASQPGLRLEAAVPVSEASLKPFGAIVAIPTTLVVDREGRLKDRWSGYIPGRAEQALTEALAER